MCSPDYSGTYCLDQAVLLLVAVLLPFVLEVPELHDYNHDSDTAILSYRLQYFVVITKVC